MGLEAVATVETLAAELTVDQAAWRGYVQKHHPKRHEYPDIFPITTFTMLWIRIQSDPGLFGQVRPGSEIIVPDPDLTFLKKENPDFSIPDPGSNKTKRRGSIHKKYPKYV